MGNFRIVHLEETDSTNRWLALRSRELSGERVCVETAFQTAGKGQGTNRWESARSCNLTASMLTHPEGVEAREQFLLSMAAALSVADALQEVLPHGLTAEVKWPNDIYVGDRKIAGILIECRLKGCRISDCITGIGLNVNQREFVGDAPNPVSIVQLTDRLTDRQLLLQRLLGHYDRRMEMTRTESGRRELRREYRSRLWRREGLHGYADGNGLFRAVLADVEDDGHLVLCDEDGRMRRYAFKEVKSII